MVAGKALHHVTGSLVHHVVDCAAAGQKDAEKGQGQQLSDTTETGSELTGGLLVNRHISYLFINHWTLIINHCAMALFYRAGLLLFVTEAGIIADKRLFL
jgi:hypothetical protein